MEELKIEPKFRDLIPPLTEAEQRQLEENILDAGQIYEPIVVWNGTIIDGHHRYEIAMKYPDITWGVREMDFPNEYAAMAWACNNQLGRRNLTDAQKTYLIGKRLDNEKAAWGGQIGNKNASKNEDAKVATPFSESEPPRGRTAERLAKEYGVGQGTVNRAADFARGVDIADEIEPGIKDSVLSEEIKVPKSTIQQISRAEPEAQKKAVKSIADRDIQMAKKILAKDEPRTKVCKECGRELPITDFPIRADNGTRRNLCRNCFHSTQQKKGVANNIFGISPEYKGLTYEQIVGNLDGNEDVVYTDNNFVEELVAIFNEFEKSTQRHFSIHKDLLLSDECKRSIAARMAELRTTIERWEDKL